MYIFNKHCRGCIKNYHGRMLVICGASVFPIIKVDNNLVLDNGTLFSIGSGKLVHGGKVYYKY